MIGQIFGIIHLMNSCTEEEDEKDNNNKGGQVMKAIQSRDISGLESPSGQ